MATATFNPTPTSTLTASVLGVGPAGPDAESAHLEIQTIPPLEGVRFSLDGQLFVSDSRGMAEVQIESLGWHRLEAMSSAKADDGVRMVFAGWCCGMEEGASRSSLLRVIAGPSGVTRLEAFYKLSYLVTPSFVDQAGEQVDSERIASLVLRSSLGGRLELAGAQPTWLVGGLGVRESGQPVHKEVQYAVESVTLDGAQVLPGSAQRFSPSQSRQWGIEIQIFAARVIARDALFGYPIGSGILLHYPNGNVERHPFGSGAELTLAPLTPGTYLVSIEGAPGISPTVPLSVTGNEAVVVRVMSYLDFAVLFLVVDSVILGVILRVRPQRLREFRLRARSLPGPWSREVVRESESTTYSDAGTIEVWYQ